MAENQNNQNEASRDVSMDISSLLKSSKEAPVKEKSPLEKMKEEKEAGMNGLIIGNDELHDSDAPRKVKNKSDADASNYSSGYLQEMDKMIDVAKNVVIEKKPENPIQMAALMDSLADSSENGAPVEGLSINTNPKQEPSTQDTPAEEVVEITPEQKERQEIVNILIDKTGLGGDFKFTDDEKSKMVSASQLVVKEVEEVDISTIKVKKSKKSFIESVDDFQISSSKVPVVFPASRFKAYMTGLSYGEMGDISLNSESVTFDQIHKKLSVIYNKMINPSIGKFTSFDDFLKKFSYTDIDIAVYGLVVATFPEIEDIPLTCNNEKCKQSFNHKYSPRTLIRFDKAGDKFLKSMKDIVECDPKDVLRLASDSPTQVHKRVRLPYSKFIIEIGIASSYDYLYTIVDNMVGDKFSENHPDDVNGILQLNSALLGLIRAVYVPDGDEYVVYDEFEDMIHALYMVKPEEIAILSSLLQKFTDGYSVTFELTDIVCPHCGTKTPSIPLDINYMVFLKYQRLMSTEIDTNNITVL